MEKDLKLEYAVYLLQNMFKEIDDYIDFHLLSFEEFKKQFIENNHKV